jgi:hypothetical protein
LKPEIPLAGSYGIPLRDDLEPELENNSEHKYRPGQGSAPGASTTRSSDRCWRGCLKRGVTITAGVRPVDRHTILRNPGLRPVLDPHVAVHPDRQ